jgi:DNA-binding HxlR family transcriptional regulator
LLGRSSSGKLIQTGRADKKVGYTQKSSYPGITPDIAATGVEEALKVLQGRWKLIILFYLFRDGTLRLSKLERAIPGITQKVLIQQLRSLERHGVVRLLLLAPRWTNCKSNYPKRF